MQRSVWKPILIATLVCGTLDILWAAFLTLSRGKEVGAMLRFVASGPFPDATGWGTAGSLLGLAVHYGLMAIMVAALIATLRHRAALLDTPWRTALAYGIITYLVMNWLVVPLRFHAPLPPKLVPMATQLFAHICLLGVPATFIGRRYLRG